MTEKNLSISDVFERIFLAVRRRYLFRFRKKYITASLSLRKGGCKRCPCCQTRGLLNKNGKCKYLKGKNCQIYHKGIPPLCKLYPLDEYDKTSHGRSHCGYYWTKSDLKKLDKKFKVYHPFFLKRRAKPILD